MSSKSYKKTPKKWAVTSSILNTIWLTLFERMVSVMWAGGPYPYTITSYLKYMKGEGKKRPPLANPDEPYYGLSNAYLLLYVDYFLGKVGDRNTLVQRLKQLNRDFAGALEKEYGKLTDPPRPFDPSDVTLEIFFGEHDQSSYGKCYNEKGVTPGYAGRLDLLRRYLGQKIVLSKRVRSHSDDSEETTRHEELKAVHSLPIRFFESEDVFDFVISASGLDLFVPQSPFCRDSGDSVRDVHRAYMFRKTGVRPIGLPIGLGGYPRDSGTIPIPALSGPSRIALDDPDVVAWAIMDPVGPGGRKWLGEALGRGVDIGVFTTALRGERDWQLMGAVYREMMNVIPRVIANIWYDDPAEKGSDLGRRYFDNSNRGLREVLERRMELGLPRRQRMVCVGKDPDWPWYEWSPTNPAKMASADALISERGFLFPRPYPRPDRSRLLEAWIRGEAGNPMFTNSVPGGGI